MRKKILNLIIFGASLLALASCGQHKDVKPKYDIETIYDGYYKNIVSWTNGEDLKNQLYKRLHDGYQPLKYDKPNWISNQYADQTLDNFDYIDVVYSSEDVLKNSTNTLWQREHAFPASLMTGLTTGNATKVLGRATDFHNLFASNASGNTSRGNKNLGYADTTSSYYRSSKDTGIVNADYSFDNLNFEPSDEDKGKLARAIFYMCTMYSVSENESYQPLTIQEEYVDYSAGNCQFAIGNLSDLLKWNTTCPVSRIEMQHNISVYEDVIPLSSKAEENYAQGNRNPFVDYPELVNYIFGDKYNESGKLEDLIPSSITLDLDKDNISNYAIKNSKFEYLVGETFTKNDYELFAVKSNFSTAPINFVDVTADYTFTANDGVNGKKEIKIVTPINEIKYTVKVKSSEFASCDYQYFTADGSDSTLFKKLNESNEIDATLNNWVWSVKCSNTIPVQKNKFGVQFGNSKNPCNKLTFSSKIPFDYHGKKKINKLIIIGNTASGKTNYITFKVNDSVTSNLIKMSYNKLESQIYSFNLPEPCEGIIEIEISNVHDGAVYIQGIGVGFSE